MSVLFCFLSVHHMGLTPSPFILPSGLKPAFHIYYQSLQWVFIKSTGSLQRKKILNKCTLTTENVINEICKCPPLLPGNAWDKAHAKHAHTQISAHWLRAAEGNQAADVWQVDVNSGCSSAGLGPSLHAADKLVLKTAKLKILWITSAPIRTAGVERNVHGLPENHTH